MLSSSSVDIHSSYRSQLSISQQLESKMLQFRPLLPDRQPAAAQEAKSPRLNNSPAYTPRKFLKTLAVVLKCMYKHHANIGSNFLGALKNLEYALNQASSPYENGATGRLHHYLVEDLHVNELHSASSAVYTYMYALLQTPREADADLQADVASMAQKLAAARCVLPASQLQLIDAFRQLCHNMDPSLDIPDGVQKAAEHVVREVVREVHGPFFNTEILEREVGHLVRVATHIDPTTQRLDASTVKLLASTLLNLGGEESSDDEDFDAPAVTSDPFLLPCLPQTMRLGQDHNPLASAAGCNQAAGSPLAGPVKGLNSGLGSPRHGAAAVTAHHVRKPGLPSVQLHGDAAAAGGFIEAGDFRIAASGGLEEAGVQGTGDTAQDSSCDNLQTGCDLISIYGRSVSAETFTSAMSSPSPTFKLRGAAVTNEQRRLASSQEEHTQQQQQQQQQQAGCVGLPPKAPAKQLSEQQLEQQDWDLSMLAAHQQQQRKLQAILSTNFDSSGGGAPPGPRASHPNAFQEGAAAAAAYLERAARRSEKQQQQQEQQEQQEQPTHQEQQDDTGEAAAAALADTLSAVQEHFRLALQAGHSSESQQVVCPAVCATQPTSTEGGAAFIRDTMKEETMHAAEQDQPQACTLQGNMKLLNEGVDRLARFIETTRRVRGLSLAHNMLGPAGMERLCQAMLVFRTVQSLDLPGNALGDAGAAAIADLLDDGCKITSLQLSGNNISDTGMIRLAQAIQESGWLQSLSIYSNNIGPRGCRALAEAVRACRSLKIVEFLPGNCASTRDIKILARAVKRNRRCRLMQLFSSGCLQA